MPITHAFQSTQGNSPNAVLVQPSNWNASHVAVDGILAVSAIYTALATDETLQCTAGAVGFTITLPAVASLPVGKNYHINRVDSGIGVVTIDGNGTEKINGLLTYLLENQWQYVWIYSDGTQWIVKGAN